MGLSPEQVLAMSLHDYDAAIYHFNRDRAGDEDDAGTLSDGDFDEMMVAMAAQGVH